MDYKQILNKKGDTLPHAQKKKCNALNETATAKFMKSTYLDILFQSVRVQNMPYFFKKKQCLCCVGKLFEVTKFTVCIVGKTCCKLQYELYIM